MIEAIRVRVRYDMPNENGETRRERNDKHDTPSPSLFVPQSGRFLWNWYFQLSDSLRRLKDGFCEPIPPSEFLAWKEATGTFVYPNEYAILRAMDVQYCSEMNQELSDFRARKDEDQKRDLERTKRSNGRGRKA